MGRHPASDSDTFENGVRKSWIGFLAFVFLGFVRKTVFRGTKDPGLVEDPCSARDPEDVAISKCFIFPNQD